MKRRIFSLMLALVLLVSLSLVTAAPVTAEDDPPNTVESGTLIFQGSLTVTGTAYSGTIAMVNEATLGIGDSIAGFDIYARDGAVAMYYQGPDEWDYLNGTVSNHDAYYTGGGWGAFYDPDCADYNHYQLVLADGTWAVEYSTTPGTSGSGIAAPMSGSINWNTLYAAETGTGAYYPGEGPAKHPGYALSNEYTSGDPAGAWDMDWSWGSEYIPLEYPGFNVKVEACESGQYRVTLTPDSAKTNTTTLEGGLNAVLSLTVSPTSSPTVTIVKSPALIAATSGQADDNAEVEAAIVGLTPIVVTLANTGTGASNPIRANPIGADAHLQLWAKDSLGNWFDINITGWGPEAGESTPAGTSETTEVYVISDQVGVYSGTVTLQDMSGGGSGELVPDVEATATVQVDPVTISIAAPGTLTFDTFDPGQFNYGNSLGGAVTANSSQVGWTIVGLGDRFMQNQNDNKLANPLLIGPVDGSWHPADGIYAEIAGNPYSEWYTTSGTGNGSFNLFAAQYIVATDLAGSYTDTITFTISYTP